MNQHQTLVVSAYMSDFRPRLIRHLLICIVALGGYSGVMVQTAAAQSRCADEVMCIVTREDDRGVQLLARNLPIFRSAFR